MKRELRLRKLNYIETLKKASYSVIAGILSGILFFLIMKGTLFAMFGMTLSPLPLLLIGLSLGLPQAIFASVIGWIIVSILSVGSISLIYIIWDIMPCLVLVYLTLKHKTNASGKTVWYPIGYISSVFANTTYIIALITVLAVTASVGDLDKSQASNITFSIQDTISAMLTTTSSDTFKDILNDKDIASNVARITPVFIALIAFAWFARITLVAIIAQAILQAKNLALRPRPNYTEIYIQNWVLPLLAFCALIGLTNDGNLAYIILNFAYCLGLPFLILGLSYVHRLANKLEYTRVILLVFYSLLTLAFLFGVKSIETFMLLSAIGLYEQIYRMYKNYTLQRMEKK